MGDYSHAVVQSVWYNCRMNKIKGWLITGLLVFIPFWATAVVVYKAFGFLDGWSQYIGIKVPGLGIVILAAVLILIGIVTRNYVGRKSTLR